MVQNDLDGFISHAAVPTPEETPFSPTVHLTTSSQRPILITTEPPKGQIIISHIPEEYSQNPEHINHIG